MIYLEKYGGSILTSNESLIDLANKIKNQLTSFKPNDRLILIVSAFKGETKRLLAEIKAINPQVTKDLIDAYLVLGELASSNKLAAGLQNHQIKVKVLNAIQIPILTDHNFNDANITRIYTPTIYQALVNHQVVIIPGFQGTTPDLKFTTLGFGGSDLTTMVLYRQLLADHKEVVCHLYKDVLGIYDPSISKASGINCYLESISHQQLVDLTSSGAKVFDHKASLYALKHQLSFTIGANKLTATLIK